MTKTLSLACKGSLCLWKGNSKPKSNAQSFMAYDFFSSETRLLFIQEAESCDVITKIKIFVDDYFLVPLLVLDYDASRKAKFLHQHDNGPRDALSRHLHFQF